MLTTKAVGVGKTAEASAQASVGTGKTRPIPIIIAARFFLTTDFIARFINILFQQTRSYFLMTRTNYRLVLALALSLILHFAPFISALISPPTPPVRQSPPIEARLRPPAPTPASQAPLLMPEQTAPPPAASLAKVSLPKPHQPRIIRESPGRKNWQEEVRQQLKKMDERGQFYPAAAIAQGLEGEALVLLIIDENGQVSAARLEQSSGHRLLDDAALRAVRSLRSLPADAPRDTLLPVRFRLK